MNYYILLVGLPVGYLLWKYSRLVYYLYYFIRYYLRSTASNSSPPSSSYELLPGSSVIKISYLRHGENFSVYLPYHRSSISEWSGKKVYVKVGDKLQEITQQPGIPYFVTSKDFNGNRILVTTSEGDLTPLVSFDEK